MNWKGYGREQSNMTHLLPTICLEGMRRTRNLSQEREFVSKDLNPGNTRYDTAVLPISQWYSLMSTLI